MLKRAKESGSNVSRRRRGKPEEVIPMSARVPALLVAYGAACGIIAGVALGAMVGPAGVAVGVALGSIIGMVAGNVMENEERRAFALSLEGEVPPAKPSKPQLQTRSADEASWPAEWLTPPPPVAS
jgi:phage tail tape-measure protein